MARETPEPSVFAHEILNANPYAYLDDAPLEERRARAVSLRRGLPADIANDVGKLDAEAIEAVVEEARPDLRNADELHDLLLDVGALPEAEAGASDGLARRADRRRSRHAPPCRPSRPVGRRRASLAGRRHLAGGKLRT